MLSIQDVIMNQSAGFRDVHRYPMSCLRLSLDGVCIPLTYRSEWQDGFGARGWKLDVSIDNPAIIASTRETGGRIPTSVLVHDVLDHFLSGFEISGHRAEAMALVQLGERTDSDIRHDYLQMVNEDVRHGRVNGESLHSFLPDDLLARVPDYQSLNASQLIIAVKEQFGENALVQRLVQHFFELGELGRYHAIDSWRLLGLDKTRSRAIGLALQNVLCEVDEIVEWESIERLKATLIVGNEQCAMEIHDADTYTLNKRYVSWVSWPDPVHVMATTRASHCPNV